MEIAKKFKAALTAQKLNKVIQVCNALKLNPNWMLAVFYFETGGTFSTSITNSIGSVGLIQFTRDKAGVNYKTIGGVQYSLQGIAAMSWENQLDLIQKYYKEAIGSKKIKSFTDLYLATFFPVAVGKPDGFVLQSSGLSAQLIANQNPAFDWQPKDGKLTKGEVTAYFRKKFNALGLDFDTEINQVSTVAFPVLAGLGLFFYTCGTVANVIHNINI